MRFATLVVLAVVASTTPGLAAPAPYTPRQANPKRDTTTTTVQNGTLSANVGSDIIKLVNDILPEIKQLLGHAVNGTGASSTVKSKRNITPNVKATESSLDGLMPTMERDVTASIAAALQNYLENAIPLEAIDGGASSNSKREWHKAIDGVERLPGADSSGIQSNGATPLFHDRRTPPPKVSPPKVPPPKVPPPTVVPPTVAPPTVAPPTVAPPKDSSLTTWLGNLGNVASIGAGGAAIAGVIGGSGASNSTGLKREFVPASNGIDLDGLLDESTPQFHDRRTGSAAPKVSSAAPKVSSTEASSLTTWLKNLGNVASIGSGGAAIVGAVSGSGSSNSTGLKREFVPASDEIDLAGLLDGSTPQFHDRRTAKISSTGVSGLESILGKLAGVASVGGTAATLLPAFLGSSNSTRRDLELDMSGPIPSADEKRSISSDVLHGIISILEGTISGSGSTFPIKRSTSDDDILLDMSGPIPSADEKRSIPSDVLQGIISVLEGAISGSGSTFSIKRSTSDDDSLGLADITPEQLQQIVAQMISRGVDLD